MTQKRYFNYGEPASAAIFKEMLSGLTGKTILSGGELGVSAPDRVVISPIWVAMDSPRTTESGAARANLLLYEDSTKQLQVTLSSAAANYTITYRHSDVDVFGGNAAELKLEAGLLRNANLADGLVIGYVLYPGGGVPLSNYMLIAPPAERVEALTSPADGLMQTPPFHSMLNYHLGGPIPYVSTVDDTTWRQCYEIDNRPNTVPSIDRLRWSYMVPRVPPQTITLDYVQETGLQITLDIEDSDGSVSTATWAPGATMLTGMLTNDFTSDFALETVAGQSLVRRRVRITNGNFEPGKRFRIQATVQTAAGKRTLIAGAGHSPYRLPFAG